MSQTFSYVKYDQDSMNKQEAFKSMFEQVEAFTFANLKEGRARSLLLTYLEIAFMWTGKAIRDEQISRNVQPAHVPERSAE